MRGWNWTPHPSDFPHESSSSSRAPRQATWETPIPFHGGGRVMSFSPFSSKGNCRTSGTWFLNLKEQDIQGEREPEEHHQSHRPTPVWAGLHFLNKVTSLPGL